MQEDINKLNICMHELKKDLDYIKASVSLNKTDNTLAHDKIMAKIDKFIDSAENKYAGRWTEKVLIWAGIGVGSALIIAFMNLIIK